MTFTAAFDLARGVNVFLHQKKMKFSVKTFINFPIYLTKWNRGQDRQWHQESLHKTAWHLGTTRAVTVISNYFCEEEMEKMYL